MTRSLPAAALIAGLLTAAVPGNAVAVALPAAMIGTWINPHRSVAVQTSLCGMALCGRVVWASAAALRDAADAGALIGTELLRDYTPSTSGRWQGHVYVPDMGRTFESTLVPQDRTSLGISGCVLGGLICKTQVWSRI